MRKNFLTGFLSGICGALFLSFVGMVTYIYVTDVPNKSPAHIEDVSATEDKDEDPYEEIVEKLSVMQMLIDRLYRKR